jgi:DNA ligase-1
MIYETILDLSGTTSKKEKATILQRDDSPLVREVFSYALDPFKMFYIRKIPEHKPAAKSSVDWEHVRALLDQLSARTLSGHAARDAVKGVLEKLDTADGDVFKKILDKDLRCGTAAGIVNSVYKVPDKNKKPKGLIPEFDVMLAEPQDEKHLTFPRWAEPKYDGMRAVFLLSGPTVDECTVLSRRGKPITTLDFILAELLKIFPVGTMVDGEALVVGDFQASMSAIKRGKKNDKTAEAKFVIFDVLTIEEFEAGYCPVPFEERLKRRLELPASATMLMYPFGRYVNNMREVEEFYAEVRAVKNAAGKSIYEGLILKQPDAPYYFQRHYAWMKVKPRETADVEITGYRAGTPGKGHEHHLGSLEFVYKGQDCRVTSFENDLRDELWKIKDTLIGRLMEVSFMELTNDGKTRHAVFHRFRDFKGEKA